MIYVLYSVVLVVVSSARQAVVAETHSAASGSVLSSADIHRWSVRDCSSRLDLTILSTELGCSLVE